MALPEKPTGDYALRKYIYAINSNVNVMTDEEMRQGRNMTGETETLLSSIPNVHKDDYLLRYLCTQVQYLNEVIDYIIKQQNIQ
nr:MAG TPA: hypothetical protein [Caudoviricetes sp.]